MERASVEVPVHQTWSSGGHGKPCTSQEGHRPFVIIIQISSVESN